MKKLISLILSLSMVFTAFSAVSAYTDTAENGYASEIAVLSDLGIIKGYEDGSFKPNNSITRAEVVAIINRMQGLEDAAKATSNVSIYSDVKTTDWFAGDVNLATQMGVISGDGDGTFRPNDQVKYEEAVKMVVAALGYNQDYVLRRGGWPTGYLVIATENEVSKGLSISAGTPASRGVVAKLVYNALTAPTFSFKEYSTSGEAVYEVNKSKIILEEKLQTYRVVGYVVDNGLNTADKDKVRFLVTDEKVGKNIDSLKKGESATFAVGNTNIVNTLGYSLIVYIVENDKGDYEVISYIDNKNDFTIIDDNNEVLVTYADGKIGVYDEKVDTTTVYYDLATNPVFVVNGEIVNSSWTPNGGVITLVDNNNDGKIDYVYNDIYSITMVDDVIDTTNAQKIYTVDGVIDLNDYNKDNSDKIYSITLNGKSATLADLKEDDILAVAATNRSYTILATREVVEGVVTEYDNYDKLYVIDGVAYESAVCVNANLGIKNVTVGDEVAFYLDAFGKVAFVDKISSAAKNYGFVVGAGTDSSVGDTSYQIKLLDKNNNVSVYEFADKVKYNRSQEEAATVYGTVYNNGKANIIHIVNGFDATSNYADRIVTYKTNSASKIVELNSVTKYTVANDAKYNAKTRTFIGACSVDEDTVVFNLPVNSNASKDDFEILTINALSHETTYDVAFLDVEDNIAGVIVITNNENKLTQGSNLAIATKVMATQNADYDDVQNITFVQNGITKTLTTTVDVPTIEVGDVFEYAVNDNGEIYAVATTFVYDSAYDFDSNKKEQYVYGVVYSKSTNRVITIGDNRDAHAIPSNANIYLVDTNKIRNNVSVASYSEIREYNIYSDETYAVFMKYYRDEIIDVIIYKY